MPPPRNNAFLEALARRPTSRRPIWLMRQAGRYLPEYQRLRAEAGSFMNLIKTPELAARALLQPLRRYDLDAAILFSDILTIPDAMGLGLRMVEGEGPSFERPLRTVADIDALRVPEPHEDLRYVLDAVRVSREAIGDQVPLIGFAGSPWTLAAYMIEGRGGDFARALALRDEDPALLARLLECLAEAVGRYLDAQVAAGAQAVQIFDSWGGRLAAADYEEFSARWIARALEGVRTESEGRPVPRIVFVRDGGRGLAQLARLPCAAIGIDADADVLAAREALGGQKAVQGNLDPRLLCGPPQAALDATRRLLERWGDAPGHIFNVGSGITPDADPDTVAAVVECCREFDRRRAPAT